MIDIGQLRQYVIQPALQTLCLWSVSAEEILTGIVLQESQGGHWLRQVGGGPALSICQIEPRTHDDLRTWLSIPAKSGLLARVDSLLVPGLSPLDQLPGNMLYAVAMARILLYRVPVSLPAAGDIAAQAAYYKRFYNTAGGAATVEQYLANWRRVYPA